jgi:hypothetical protein
MSLEMPEGMSPYEQKRWMEIQDWKAHAALPSKFSIPPAMKEKLRDANDRVSEAWDAIPGNDRIETWIATAINGGFHMTIDAVATTIREDRIVRNVARRAGCELQAYDEFLQLDLAPLDRARPDTKVLRSAVAAGHGAASGFAAGGATAAGAASGGMGALPAAGVVAGLAGAEAVALVGGSIQGSALIGAYYGFDPKRSAEHSMLLSMLGAGAAREAAKIAAMKQVRELALALAAKQSLAQLSKKQLYNLMRQIYALLLLKTAKKNIAKGVPVLGAGLGAGLNYATARRVLETAQHLYPERFLLTKYAAPQTTEEWTARVEQILVDDVEESDRGIMRELEKLPLRELEGSANHIDDV